MISRTLSYSVVCLALLQSIASAQTGRASSYAGSPYFKSAAIANRRIELGHTYRYNIMIAEPVPDVVYVKQMRFYATDTTPASEWIDYATSEVRQNLNNVGIQDALKRPVEFRIIERYPEPEYRRIDTVNSQREAELMVSFWTSMGYWSYYTRELVSFSRHSLR